MSSNVINVIMAIVSISFILILPYHTYCNGKEYYENRKKNNKTNQKIFDIGHKYLPDLSHNNTMHILMNIIILLPLFYYYEIFPEFISYMIPIMTFRALTTTVTILPKSKCCEDESYGAINMIHGHCYDKIFSGHFSMTIMISSILYEKKLVNNVYVLGAYNIISALMILLTRSHYTVDLLIGGYVAYTAHAMKLKIECF
jgi:hypothetical protein